MMDYWKPTGWTRAYWDVVRNEPVQKKLLMRWSEKNVEMLRQIKEDEKKNSIWIFELR